MRFSLTIILSFLAYAFCDSTYLLGQQGQSCSQVCYEAGKNCNPRVITNDNAGLFKDLGVSCGGETYPDWYSEDQPSYVSDSKNDLYGNCLGYKNIPDAIQCSASNSSVSRICRCDDPEDASSTFGTGYANGEITRKEKWIFQHYVAPGDVGVLTHFWITYYNKVDKGVIVRYYIDGEKEASIQFTPSLACGVGFYDNQAPWGSEWFGKGAKDGSWFNNFRIPFQKSIVVTIQHQYNDYKRFFMLIRGSTNVPIIIGGRTLPSTARMNLNAINSTYQPLDWIPLVNESSGAGAFWQVTVAAESENNKFLEGCVHAYFDGKNEFPGVVIGTGMEDYLDSAWFFNGGEYRLPSSGFTHLEQNDTYISWSGYRFHNEDSMFWKDGFKLIWRNGDMDDPVAMKCHMISGGPMHGDANVTQVYAYSWYYTWPTTTEYSSANLLSLFIGKIVVLISICLYLL